MSKVNRAVMGAAALGGAMASIRDPTKCADESTCTRREVLDVACKGVIVAQTVLDRSINKETIDFDTRKKFVTDFVSRAEGAVALKMAAMERYSKTSENYSKRDLPLESLQQGSFSPALTFFRTVSSELFTLANFSDAEKYITVDQDLSDADKTGVKAAALYSLQASQSIRTYNGLKDGMTNLFKEFCDAPVELDTLHKEEVVQVAEVFNSYAQHIVALTGKNLLTKYNRSEYSTMKAAKDKAGFGSDLKAQAKANTDLENWEKTHSLFENAEFDPSADKDLVTKWSTAITEVADKASAAAMSAVFGIVAVFVSALF